jgi:hypothetical protein
MDGINQRYVTNQSIDNSVLLSPESVIEENPNQEQDNISDEFNK